MPLSPKTKKKKNGGKDHFRLKETKVTWEPSRPWNDTGLKKKRFINDILGLSWKFKYVLSNYPLGNIVSTSNVLTMKIVLCLCRKMLGDT